MAPPTINTWATQLNNVSTQIGRRIAFLLLMMALVSTAIVFTRYQLHMGSIAAQESVIYMHAIVIMLCGGYTLQQDKHVRVDVLYRHFSTKTKAFIDFVGHLVLMLPMMVFIFIVSWEYVLGAWKIQEASADAGGLPSLYLLKTTLLVMPSLMILQAFADIIRYTHALRGSLRSSS